MELLIFCCHIIIIQQLSYKGESKLSELCNDKILGDSDKALNDLYMDAEIVDQVNTNQQSNMTLCSYSSVTQSYSTICINSISNSEEE